MYQHNSISDMHIKNLDLQSFRPDMHHQKTLQFLQILQICSGLVLSWCPHHERLLTVEDPARSACGLVSNIYITSEIATLRSR